MDQEFADFFNRHFASAETDPVFEWRGDGVIFRSGQDIVRYNLKPLVELFDTSPQAETGSIDWTYERNLGLLEAIEKAILSHDEEVEELRDAQIALTLDRLILNVAADPGSNLLARGIQYSLRVVLSLRDYSRHEVKMALRKIAKSVDRHSRESGIRGYIDFLHAVLQE